MPNLVDVNQDRQRGPSRKYDLSEFITQSLDSGQGVHFTAEEMKSDYGVKAQAVASAARKDAERLSAQRDDDQKIDVWIRLVDRDGTDGQKELKDTNGRHYQDLILKASLVSATDSLEATEDGSEATDDEPKGRRK